MTPALWVSAFGVGRIQTVAQIASLATVVLAAPAMADPCHAIPDRGPAPTYLTKGKSFAGPVVYVADGDGLCVEVGRPGDRNGWVEVRVADFYAPELAEPGGIEAKRTLQRLAMGKAVECIAGRQTWDRVVATCRIGGASIGDQMRRAGIKEAGRGLPGARSGHGR